MERTIVTSATAPPGGPYSPGLVVGDTVYLAGQTGEGDTIEEQTESTLARVTALLAEAGCSPGDVVSCLVHLSDLTLFERVHRRARQAQQQIQHLALLRRQTQVDEPGRGDADHRKRLAGHGFQRRSMSFKP